MKTIGLIGGMSWESTVHYYRIINEEIKARLGGLHSARLILYSVDFQEIEQRMKSGDWGDAARILNNAARSLERGGADFIILCTNTLHKVAEQIREGIKIPLLHVADLTAGELLAHNIKTVGLLGTKYTMEEEFYKARLRSAGLYTIIPDENDRELVNSIIFDELCLGRILEPSKKKMLRIIEDLESKGARAIILGCTEIMLLVKEEDAALPLFDTTLIHAKKAVEYALV